MALQGLLGAIKGNFWFVTSRFTPKKYYNGKEARFWGFIFFLGFSLFPSVFLVSIFKSTEGNVKDILFYIICTIISLIIAILSRKYGMFKIRSKL